METTTTPRPEEYYGGRLLADCAAQGAGHGPAGDWGVPLVARLLAEKPGHRRTARAASVAWAVGSGHPSMAPGLVGSGFTGRALGLAHAAAVEPRLAHTAQLAAERFRRLVARTRRATPPAPSDYDLVAGAAGQALALMAMGGGVSRELSLLTSYLSGLGRGGDLPRLRIGRHGGVAAVRTQIGRTDLGLAHGVPGVLAALTALATHSAVPEPERAAEAVRDVTGFLVRHSRRDARGVVGWPFTTPAPPAQPVRRRGARPMHGSSDRQGWCYGTPGAAWQIAEAGRVLNDPALREFADDAMASLADRWDDGLHLDEAPEAGLTFCHGAAGVLAVADAFALHNDLLPARRLADYLAASLAERLALLAPAEPTVMTGSAGALAALLSRGPAQRGWMSVLGLR